MPKPRNGRIIASGYDIPLPPRMEGDLDGQKISREGLLPSGSWWGVLCICSSCYPSPESKRDSES
jgi:hypothetical protein